MSCATGLWLPVSPRGTLGQLGRVSKSRGELVLTASGGVGTGRTGEAMQSPREERKQFERKDEGAGGLLQRGAHFCLLGTTPRKSLWVLGEDENNSWEESVSAEKNEPLLTGT